MKKLNKLIRLSVLAIALALLSACGKPYPVDIDPAFMPYLETIQAQVNKRRPDLSRLAFISSVQFSTDLGLNFEAFCYWNRDNFGYTKRMIKVKPSAWEALSDNERLTLLSHEIGHCVLKKNHDGGHFLFEYSENKKIEAPRSLMNHQGSYPGALIDTIAAQDKESSAALLKYYFDELLGP